jgi:hypothetical protein
MVLVGFSARKPGRFCERKILRANRSGGRRCQDGPQRSEEYLDSTISLQNWITGTPTSKVGYLAKWKHQDKENLHMKRFSHPTPGAIGVKTIRWTNFCSNVTPPTLHAGQHVELSGFGIYPGRKYARKFQLLIIHY